MSSLFFKRTINLSVLLAWFGLALSSVFLKAETKSTHRLVGKRILKGQSSQFELKNAAKKLDTRLIQAVKIAIQRARKYSSNRCWRYVKKALVEAEVVDSYPTTRYAKQAGGELLKFGFQPIDVADPFEAPVGSILVYGGRGPGHVEFRTQCGFVSDFLSPTPSPRPLIGVYVKMRNSEG